MMTDLKTVRNSVHLSQSRLARLAGVSRYKICLHEMGELELASEELKRIDQAISDEVAKFQLALSKVGSPHRAAELV
jgi:predicted transcriptional regulator